MLRAVPALLLAAALTLSGCGGDTDDAASSPSSSPSAAPEATGFSADVRDNFLTSCLQNATETSKGAATEEQLTQTCACILGKVEEEYSEAEFAEFEQRLLDRAATEQETALLTRWSTDCAREATS